MHISWVSYRTQWDVLFMWINEMIDFECGAKDSVAFIQFSDVLFFICESDSGYISS